MKQGSLDLVQKIQQGDRLALTKLITAVEGRAPELSQVMAQVHRNAKGSHCIGVTGPPGAGKSTLVDCLIETYRKQGVAVGVLAVDPSSPFSGGAVLGDRIRMQRHALDSGVFIRSLASRGRHGGLSRATRDIRALLDMAGFGVILIETVGVGQTELDIMEVADTTVVMLVPEAGDAVQTLKAGLLEIADIFVVNKSDREGADRMFADLRSLVMMRGIQEGWETPLLSLVATIGKGIDELFEALRDHQEYCRSGVASRKPNQVRQALCEVLNERIEVNLDRALEEVPRVAQVVKEMEAGDLDPHTAADRVAEALKAHSLLLARQG